MTVADDDDWFSPDFLPVTLDETSYDPWLYADRSAPLTHPSPAPDQPVSNRVMLHRRKESHPLGLHYLGALRPQTIDSPPNPIKQEPSGLSHTCDVTFKALCDDPTVVFHPRTLGFLPLYWPDGQQTFGDLVSRFFKRKNSSNSRFLHKLFNALIIQELDVRCREVVGVEWATDAVLRVDKLKFAQLIGVKTIDGCLFHRQGNFPSHGFVELSVEQARVLLPPHVLAGVDFDTVRLLRHEPGIFVRGCGPGVAEMCKWRSDRSKDGSACC
jgi:hypothetical protein